MSANPRRASKAKTKRERVVPASEIKAKCLALFEEGVDSLSSNKTSTLHGSLLEDTDLLAPVWVKWAPARSGA
ncbi:hypothetical protein BH09MYX1_BH09MYX1_27660 [soil metagenome]